MVLMSFFLSSFRRLGPRIDIYGSFMMLWVFLVLFKCGCDLFFDIRRMLRLGIDILVAVIWFLVGPICFIQFIVALNFFVILKLFWIISPNSNSLSNLCNFFIFITAVHFWFLKWLSHYLSKGRGCCINCLLCLIKIPYILIIILIKISGKK